MSDFTDEVTKAANKARALAEKWRDAHPNHIRGIVLIWRERAYGWKDSLRDASHERPGVYAVDAYGLVYIADGGDEYNGAKSWVAIHKPAS